MRTKNSYSCPVCSSSVRVLRNVPRYKHCKCRACRCYFNIYRDDKIPTLLVVPLSFWDAVLANSMSDREKDILKLRFGYWGRKHTLREIGLKHGITRERVRQLESKALACLKKAQPELKILERSSGAKELII